MTDPNVELHVSGAEALPIDQQAAIIRLNPGVQGLSPEAYALAASKDSAGEPLPEVGSTHAVTAEVAAQNQQAAASAVPAETAIVQNAPEGGGFLVKFSDKFERYFYATEEDLAPAVANYSTTHA